MIAVSYTTEDADIMARTLFGESMPHNEQDAIAIAWVIRNRLEYKRKAWGLTVAQVCQKPMQFSCWNGGDSNYNRMVKAEYKQCGWLTRCRQIAYDVLNGAFHDPTFCSTHYHTPAVAPKWSKKKSPAYQTKGHLFFNDIDTKKPFFKTKVIAVSTVATTAVLESTDQAHVADTLPTVNEVMNNVHMITPFLHGDVWKLIAGSAIIVIVVGGIWFWQKSKRG